VTACSRELPDIGHGPDWQGKAGPQSFFA